MRFRDELIDTAHVVRVEPDQLVTMAEIAERYARTRKSVRLLIAGDRGPGGFPAPLSHGTGAVNARLEWL